VDVPDFYTMMDTFIEMYRKHNATTAPFEASPAFVRQNILPNNNDKVV